LQAGGASLDLRRAYWGSFSNKFEVLGPLRAPPPPLPSVVATILAVPADCQRQHRPAQYTRSSVGVVNRMSAALPTVAFAERNRDFCRKNYDGATK
jgi:hypothetical protein